MVKSFRDETVYRGAFPPGSFVPKFTAEATVNGEHDNAHVKRQKIIKANDRLYATVVAVPILKWYFVLV